MNFTELKDTVKNVGAQVLEKIKEALQLPYAKTYIAVTFLVLLPLFVAFTFPYGTIIQKRLQESAKSFGGVQSMVIQDMEFSLLGGLDMFNTQVFYHDGAEATFNEFSVSSFLLPLQVMVRRVFDGDINLTGFHYVSDKTDLRFNVNSNIDIKLDPKSNVPQEGDIKLELEDISLKMDTLDLPDTAVPGGLKIPIKQVKLKFIHIEGSIMRRRLTISKCIVSGGDLAGTMKGTITLDSIMKNSRLDLTISIDSNSRLIKDNPMFAENEGLRMMFQQIAGGGALAFKLQGVLARPHFTLDRSGGSIPGDSTPGSGPRGSSGGNPGVQPGMPNMPGMPGMQPYNEDE